MFRSSHKPGKAVPSSKPHPPHPEFLGCLMASGGALRQSEPHLLSHYCYLSSSDDTPSIHPHFHSPVTLSSSQVKAFIVNKNEDGGRVGKCNRGDNGDQSKSYTCLKMLKQNLLFVQLIYVNKMRVNLCQDFHVLREGRYSLSQKGTAASSSHHLQIASLMLQQAKESH